MLMYSMCTQSGAPPYTKAREVFNCFPGWKGEILPVVSSVHYIIEACDSF